MQRASDPTHTIYDLSYAEGWIACACGQFVEAIAGLVGLDEAWAVHRGETYYPRVERYVPRATDVEVHEFFERIANPWFQPSPLVPKVQAPAYRETAEDRAQQSILLIIELGKRCTCTGRTVSRDCPNFVEGDDRD